ncbi:MAG: carboxypeptidase regulatory-like domain-containing protein [Bryobacteraceae bacterium]
MFPPAKCLLLSLIAGAVFAQSKTTASVRGIAEDASQARVSQARVALINNATNARFETVTGADGDYFLPFVVPGEYRVEVAKEGFAAWKREGLELTVGQEATLDIHLDVATAELAVAVTAEVPLIESQRTQQSNTLTQDAVRNLPINRRDYLTFSLLAPGVADSKALADSNSFRVKQTPDSGLSFYGSNGRGNSVNVDGGEANDPGGGVRPTVSQEAVQEFQVNRSNYSAEHGSARGGVINIVTRSGSNQLHGSLFSFFRHQSLDATDPFAITLDGATARRVKPSSDRQQFGGTFGGPIAKDKTFFFFSYERLRRRENRTVPVLTDLSIFGPTRDQEAILQRLPAAAAGQLRATLSTPPAVQEMFRRNSGVFPFRTDDHKGLMRFDHRFSDADSVSFRYNATNIFDSNEGIGALVGQSRGFIQDFRDHTVLLNWLRAFSPRAVNEFRAQFNHYVLVTASTDPFGPSLDITGFGSFNRDRFLPATTLSRRNEIADNISVFRGKHAWKFGGNILIRNVTQDSATFFSGRFTFGALPGALVNAALAATSVNALQAFNLGLAQSYQQGFGDPTVRATFPLYAVYAQDTWTPVSGVTLNWGVRYERDNRRLPLPTDSNNFAPRLGFSWAPGKDRKTTIRGGYGFFYAPIDFQIDYVVQALNEIDGRRQIAQVLSVLNPAAPTAPTGPINIFSTLRAQGVIGLPTPQRPIAADDLRQFGINVSQTGPRPPLTVLFRPAPDYVNGYAQQFSFGIEREIVKNLAFSASYVGVRGIHLTTSRDINLLPAPVNPAKGVRDWGPFAANPTGAAFFVNPLVFQENLYESNANSDYHGLMLEATHRASRRATLHFNYTFAKAIDETTDFNSDFQPNDQIDRRAERALSSFDQRHKAVAYAVLQTPENANKIWADTLFTPIFRYSSARPFNLLAGTELNNDRHNTTDRPFFAGRNTGIGPSFTAFDLRVSRRFAVGENKKLEFMAEAFNLFNKLNYTSVNNVVGNIAGPFNLSGRDDRTPSEPLGFTSAADPRRIQLGVRFSF